MAQNKSKKITISGDEYEIFMLPPRTARGMLVDIGKTLGPALKSGSVDLGSDAAFMAVVGELLLHLDKSVLNDISDKLASVTHVNGMPLEKVFDSHFIGKMGSWTQWLVYAVYTQFSDFPSALGSASALVQAMREA